MCQPNGLWVPWVPFRGAVGVGQGYYTDTTGISVIVNRSGAYYMTPVSF